MRSITLACRLTSAPPGASTLRLAQTLDADSVIYGTYQVNGTQITATARILDIENLRESAPVSETAELSRLPDVINTIAWRVARQLDPHLPGSGTDLCCSGCKSASRCV